VALRVAEEERILVGPDNGLLAPAAEALGGVVEAVDISASPFRFQPASPSFHGRDVFSPVAAHLAAGASLEEAGDGVAPDSPVGLETTEPRFEDPGVVAHVVLVDRFGNAALDLSGEDVPRTGLELGRPLEVRTGDWSGKAVFARTFADIPGGDLLLYEDSYRSLALAVNRGDAARKLGLRHGDEVALIPR
jgi:S-adenosylmethionine hydrolase